eukprot:3230873-Prorocentrum_lima.AAC.1
MVGQTFGRLHVCSGIVMAQPLLVEATTDAAGNGYGCENTPSAKLLSSSLGTPGDKKLAGMERSRAMGGLDMAGHPCRPSFKGPLSEILGSRRGTRFHLCCVQAACQRSP